MLGDPVDQLLVAVDHIVIGHIGGELVDSRVDHLADGAFAVAGQGIQVSLLRLGVDDGLQSGSQIALGNLGLVGQGRQTVNGNINAIGGDGTVGLALSDEDVGDLIGQGQQSAVDLDAFQLVRLAAGSHQVIDLSGQAGNLSVDKADLALGAQRQFLELINSSVLGSRHIACPP